MSSAAAAGAATAKLAVARASRSDVNCILMLMLKCNDCLFKRKWFKRA